MDQPTALAIILLSALIHASFQLSVSMFTLLSGHAIGRRASRARLLRLSGSFVLGVIVMTLLLLSTLVLMALTAWASGPAPLLAYAVVAGLSVGIGIAVWAFYYRRRPGTSLWLPHPFTVFIGGRIKATRLGAEAFSLGLVSVVAELVFIIAPLAIAAIVIRQFDTPFMLAGIAGYVFIATLPLIIIVMRVNAGRSLSNIQRWRESNKRFMQFIAGSMLIVLGAFLYVSEVASVATTIREALW